MRTWMGVGVIAVALFLAGRLLHARQGPAAQAGPAGEVLAPKVGVAPESGEARRPAHEWLRVLTEGLAVAVEQRQTAERSQRVQEVLNTVNEPEAHREARRAELSGEIDRLYPSLIPAKRESLREFSDTAHAELRRLRAAFMLGQISEDKYMTLLRESMRQGVDQARRVLTREEFSILEGNPDYDLFDPRAHSVPGAPRYLTGEESK